MKHFKDFSIKVKLPVMIGGASLITLTVVCILLIVPLRSNSLENSSKIAQLSAEEAGQDVAAVVNSAASVVRSYAGVLAQLSVSNVVPNEKKRELVVMEMQAILKGEKTLYDIWCTFEPDALDGMDSLFINQPGSNSQGNFGPWIIGDKVVVLENDYEADYYTIAKKANREVIMDPYWDEDLGKPIQMFSICLPIVHHGKFLGIAGTDFPVSELNKLISSYSSNTVGKLVTDKGIIAVSHDENLIGQEAENGNREILDKLSAGKMFEGMYRVDGKEIYKVYVPIQLGEGTEPWFYAVDIPKAEIYAQARQTAGYLIVYCLAGVILISFAVWFLVQAILKGIIDVTGIIHQLSFGRLGMHIGKDQNNDEIGKMKTELSSLVSGLQRTADFAQKIGEGNLNAEYQLLSDDDVLGNSLLEMRLNLQKATDEATIRKEEEDRRTWVTTGVAKFADILRQDNSNLEALSDNVISHLVKYLGANQGGIFILEEDGTDKFLEMKACYAYDRKKFIQKRIQLGEGLVGTCYLEGEPIYMTQLPDSYVTITSGLGDSNPKALLLCPLKVNGEIYGVMEIASFQTYEPYQLEFVQKVSESIASTVSTVRINVRTERLLGQTKLQAEEMANQEEELRQNMEEMQATQEEMRRREAELNNTLVEMKKMQEVGEEKDYEMQQFYKSMFDSFNMVEFSPEALITDINQKVIDTFEGAAKVDFIGKSLSDVIGEDTAQTAWSAIVSGKSFENVQPVNTGPGKSTVFKQKFIPICNNKGTLQRVLLMALPV